MDQLPGFAQAGDHPVRERPLVGVGKRDLVLAPGALLLLADRRGSIAVEGNSELTDPAGHARRTRMVRNRDGRLLRPALRAVALPRTARANDVAGDRTGCLCRLGAPPGTWKRIRGVNN